MLVRALLAVPVIGIWVRGPHGEGKTMRHGNGDRVYVDPTPAIRIELPEGRTPIMPILHTFEGSIIDTINSFRPHA